MKKSTLAFITILTFLILCDIKTATATSPIGITEYDNDTNYLIAWNQGNIINTTFLHKPTGFVQHANYINNVNDMIYVYGYARPRGANFLYIGLDAIPNADIVYYSDNTNLWYASSKKTIGQHTFIKNNSQNLYSDYVNMSFTYRSTNAILGNSYFVFGIRQLDIAQDQKGERILLLRGCGNITEIHNNLTGTHRWENITRLLIDSNETGGVNYDIIFPKGVILIYNLTSPAVNGDLTFFDYIGVVAANTPYHFNYKWIDAACTVICPFSCNVYVQCNTTTLSTTLKQYELTKKTYCRWYDLGFGCGSRGCSISRDCRLSWCIANPPDYSYNQMTILNTDDITRGAEANMFISSPFKNVYYGLQVRGGRVYNDWGILTVRLGNSCASYSASCSGSEYNTTLIYRNITLLTPKDNTTINKPTWFNFTANYSWTASYYDNLSLFFSNATQAIITLPAGGAFLDENITVDESINWTVQACYSHACFTQWHSSFTIIREYAPVVVDVIKKARSDDDLMYIIIISCVCMIILSFTLFDNLYKIKK